MSLPLPIPVRPCPWPIDTSCCPEWEELEQDLRERVQEQATDLLWALSGRQFTTCPTALRPCARQCGCIPCESCPRGGGPSRWGAVIPYMWGGQWFNAWPCGCGPGWCHCGATPLASLQLPGPVGQIISVTEGEETLPTDAYTVLADREGADWLVRLDGEAWPTCQDQTAACGQAGAFCVTYIRGHLPPLGAQRAVGVLACELARLCTGGKCRIPAGVTNVTRDGVQFELDTSATYGEGRIGIPEIDMWLAAVNPGKLRRRGAVYSPDLDWPGPLQRGGGGPRW